MKSSFKSIQKGFAIIEALIAFLLLGIGVSALLYLQGNLMSGGSVSKARAEAMEIAKDRTELLRNYIGVEQYKTALSNVQQNETVGGVNAQYTVSYPNLPIPANYKDAELLTVKVAWSGTDDKVESVTLETMLYFIRPEIIATIADQNDGLSDPSDSLLPSPWIAGVERAEDGTGQIGSGTEILSDDETATGSSSVNLGLNSNGNWEIYLGGTRTNSGVVLTAFGGIIHKIRGKIHIEETHIVQDDLDEMAVIATSPAYCEYPVYSGACPEGLGGKCVEYLCFVPGDCSETDFGSAPDDCKKDENGDISETDYLSHQEDIKALELNGGWYGKVGLFGVPESPFDDIITGDSCRDPARLYSSLRLCKSSDEECAFLNPPIESPSKFPASCEYQKGCTFQMSSDTNYTGYISHCVGNPADEEITDGYCIEDTTVGPTGDGTPYGIYEVEGINGSYAYNHFWLIDKALNDSSCGIILDRFSQSVNVTVPTGPELEDPQYLVDHRIVRPLVQVPPEPANVITAPNNMGLVDWDDLNNNNIIDEGELFDRIPPPAS
jgi:hypothetical protein